jgi:cellulose synthase/poly-beta-1,6-N-acetylglucosamine synthase-like glycosyltransferase
VDVFFWSEIILLTYFAYVATYSAVFSLAGRMYVVKTGNLSSAKNYKFAVFIPAYKEDGVIIDVAKQSLNQNYTNYEVIVIADSLQKRTLDRLRELPIKIIEVSFEKSTKVKALKAALAQYDNQYDYAVILDADNIMEPNFISTLNKIHQLGYQSIQGRRAAKNSDTTMAFLDGLSEEINNHIMCKGSTALGLSSSLKGSGMSFNYKLLKQNLGEMDSIGGFDRELELRLANKGYKSIYVDNAIIYDEKVSNTKVFENQRKRWISSQFYYLSEYFQVGMFAFFKGQLALFNSTILRNIQLPRLLNLGLLVIFTLCSGLFSFWYSTLYIYWLAVAIITFGATLLAIPNEYYGKQLLQAIISLPKVFLKMFFLLFKLKGANKKFIHTPHTSNSTSKDS